MMTFIEKKEELFRYIEDETRVSYPKIKAVFQELEHCGLIDRDLLFEVLDEMFADEDNT